MPCEPPRPPGCPNVDGTVLDVAGLRIAGLGGCVRYRPGPNQYSQREYQRRAAPPACAGSAGCSAAGPGRSTCCSRTRRRAAWATRTTARTSASRRCTRVLAPAAAALAPARPHPPATATRGPTGPSAGTTIRNVIPYRMIEITPPAPAPRGPACSVTPAPRGPTPRPTSCAPGGTRCSAGLAGPDARHEDSDDRQGAAVPGGRRRARAGRARCRSGVQVIPVDRIVGSVDKVRDFDPQFRPRSGRSRQRWERIAEAARRGEPLPPIDVYQVGEMYFVRDGHHRVSVYRALDLGQIEADVRLVHTLVEPDDVHAHSDLVRPGAAPAAHAAGAAGQDRAAGAAAHRPEASTRGWPRWSRPGRPG